MNTIIYRDIESLLPARTWLILPLAAAGMKHSCSSRFMSDEGRVMCGYQGRFHAAGDGSGEGWVHYTRNGSFKAENLKVDPWPDVAEYRSTHPTSLKMPDGSAARVFSSPSP